MSPEGWKQRDLIAMYLAFEGDRFQLVERLSKGDKKKAKHWRKKLVRMAMEPEFQELMAMYVKAIQVLDLGPTVAALSKRAMKGNVPAIKLALESVGYYSPRQLHEHSGDIEITIRNAPRPDRVEDDVVDAEVVED